MPAVTKLLSASIAAGSSALYKAQLLKDDGTPLPGSSLASLTLSLFDTMTEEVVNNVEDVNILNTGRGSIDDEGNLQIILMGSDTAAIGTPPFVDASQFRSMVIKWVDTLGTTLGEHQVDFKVTVLVGTL